MYILYYSDFNLLKSYLMFYVMKNNHLVHLFLMNVKDPLFIELANNL